VRWSDGNGSTTQLRARRTTVALNDDFLRALRQLMGPDRVRLVKAP